jgi:hypothetical protein
VIKRYDRFIYSLTRAHPAVNQAGRSTSYAAHGPSAGGTVLGPSCNLIDLGLGFGLIVLQARIAAAPLMDQSDRLSIVAEGLAGPVFDKQISLQPADVSQGPDGAPPALDSPV